MRIQQKLNLTLIDVIVVLSGLALLLLIGYSNNPTISTLLDAIGTSLIAAGFVSYLTRRFYSQEQHDTIKVVSETRMVLENEYRQRKQSANRIDIVGIALSGCLKELASDPHRRLLKRILFSRARVRLIFLNPLANYVSHRAIEDAISVAELQTILKQSVIYCIEIYQNLTDLYQSAIASGTLDRVKMGGLEIRMIDMCPHFTIYRTDNVILWGIYTAAGRGLDSAVLYVPEEQTILFGQLVSHFDKLWDKNLLGPSGNNYLVRYFDPNIPTLNEGLVAEVLGSGWKEQYWKSNDRVRLKKRV